jgi:hypothetical protein
MKNRVYMISMITKAARVMIVKPAAAMVISVQQADTPLVIVWVTAIQTAYIALKVETALHQVVIIQEAELCNKFIHTRQNNSEKSTTAINRLKDADDHEQARFDLSGLLNGTIESICQESRPGTLFLQIIFSSASRSVNL